jgi:hypothetical protein
MITAFIPQIHIHRFHESLHGIDLARIGLRSFHGSNIIAVVNFENGITEAPRPQGTVAK